MNTFIHQVSMVYNESLSKTLENVRGLHFTFFYDNTSRPHSAFLTIDRTK